MNKIPETYRLIEEREVSELGSRGYLLRHNKSGAKVFLLENDDENKVFYIGFRTPPSDSTGVAHIMEHSVLCGSKHFPAKDPFVELAKGSLNTFLNAMTYPDKTVYPVASCNDKDFKNLMHVYMDAVFEPNIYSRPQIFRQEGWHYEMADENSPLTLNGVVYNEMKGAFSSPEDVVERRVYQSLYPDTTYSLESGGDPEVIPDLTPEAFLDFHKKFYHPSNSFIYLYGNCDMEERLNWLDEAYLSSYETIEVDSALELQKSFEKTVTVDMEYGITEEEDEEDNSYLVYSTVVDTALNRELYLAFQILDYTLLSAPGAPLNEKLLRSGLGQDIISSYENGIYQPCFSIMAKNARWEDRDRFYDTIKATLSELCEKGLDKKALRAGINYFEFKYREADFGTYPKGLMYGLQCLDSWLYDENDPFMHISAVETIEFLKSRVDTDYFEELIRKYLLDNPHSSLVCAKPVKGLISKKEAALASDLAQKKESLGSEEIADIVRNTAELKKYQEEPSAPEELLSIPLLQISDIEKKAKPIENEAFCEDGINYLFHEIKTNGIGYISLLFDMSALPSHLLGAAAILKSMLMMVSTERYSYFELANEINMRTGGISVNMDTFCRSQSEDDYSAFITIDARYLEGDLAFVLDMFREILFTSDLEDVKRIRELLLMLKSRLQMHMMNASHTLASLRAKSYFSDAALFMEHTGGYEFYKKLEEICAGFEKDPSALIGQMKQVLPYVLRRDALLVDFTGSTAELSRVKEGMKEFVALLSDVKSEKAGMDLSRSECNEGFKTSGQVQYVAVAGDYRSAGLDYTGALKVLHTILGYDYLWINVRVKGGAYGAMSSFPRTGGCYMVSYRDPALSATLDIFRGAASYLESFDASERDMRKYIIGTISAMDTPLSPRMRGSRSLGLYLMGITNQVLQSERDEVLSCTPASVRALAPYVKAVTDQGRFCVVGAEERIRSEEEIFGRVANLF